MIELVGELDLGVVGRLQRNGRVDAVALEVAVLTERVAVFVEGVEPHGDVLVHRLSGVERHALVAVGAGLHGRFVDLLAVGLLQCPVHQTAAGAASEATLVMNQFVYTNLSYDPFSDFVPITTVTKTVSVVAVSGTDGPKDVQELIARAKAAPGKLNYGAGTITAQLMGYRFHKAAGLDIQYVPFKGTPATVNGLLTGSVDIIYAANVTVNPLIESGKVRALAKLDRRSPTSMANIPTLADAAGLPNLDDMSVWLGLVAPKGTPRPIIDKLNAKIVQIMADPAMREKSERTGAYPMTGTPEEFAHFMRQEADRWAPVLKETGIKFD